MSQSKVRAKEPGAVELRLSQRWSLAIWEISRIESNLKALQPATVASLACLRDRLCEVWKDIEALKMDAISSTEFFSTIHEQNFSQCENAYLAVKQLLNEKYEPFEKPLTVASACHHASLPSIKIPKFDGRYRNWQRFRDLFTQLVINQVQIPDSQKLVHLMSSLEAEPLKLVSVLTVSDRSFQQAWALLRDRYDDKSKILEEHIHALFSFPSLKIGDASSLRELHNVVTSHWLSMSAVPTTVPMAEIIVQFLVLSKLDNKTREAFFLAKAKNDIVPLQNVLDFLSLRARALDIAPLANPDVNSVSVSKSKRPTQSSPAKQVFQLEEGSSARACIACSSGEHPLFACPRFRTLAVQQRWDFVSSHQLCYNCLRRKGPSHHCSQRSCKTCGEGIRCYDCYSIKDLFCNDPFHKNSTASKDYPPGNVCVKLKGNLYKEDGFVIRREGMVEQHFDELKRSKTFPEGTQMEKCYVDLCNAAGTPTASVAAAVAAAAAAASALFWR